jgi:hypothetical protein
VTSEASSTNYEFMNSIDADFHFGRGDADSDGGANRSADV